jgi:hypothetical protein
MVDLDKAAELVRRLSNFPLSTENLHSTWCPPEYDDITSWWDEFVQEARDAVK